MKAKLFSALTGGALLAISGVISYSVAQQSNDSTPQDQNEALIAQGQQVFRFNTFGDEITWTDKLQLNTVISQAVDPLTALAVGLKVDVDALPEAVQKGITGGSIDLSSPATTVALLKLDAVVGVKGTVETVNGTDTLTQVGVTCALCHSTVDNSFIPGIGHRLDGWPNHDLDPGKIIALSPAFSQADKDKLNSWGPGMYDPRFNIDGLSDPVVIPPAYGLEGVHSVVYTGDGPSLSYWNRYVAVTQMGGQGLFSDPRIGTHINPDQPGLKPGWHPGVFVVNGKQDLVTSNLAALQAYQLSISAPLPPEGSFDPDAAARGEGLFDGSAGCARCHSGPKFTDANQRLHPPADTVAEDKLYVTRSATGMWRTTPLRGLWQHPPYLHDGSAQTLSDVVQIYNDKMNLGLTSAQMSDLAEYLKTL
ncbi:lipoprotein [Candidatus Nitrosoglobus terrae]|uniref:Lipoprotein n=1 Tax=Candidatus Nitrosoglobus terrae TaxID=1630141 RepID=A0A1Q2SMA2_9GAMM|nr:c-type cytochrome [Candidatus Nitrosoglobus terrae]BAW80264.1 lipoprotein [Candidatus Nitrosoglobus terrae]